MPNGLIRVSARGRLRIGRRVGRVTRGVHRVHLPQTTTARQQLNQLGFRRGAGAGVGLIRFRKR